MNSDKIRVANVRDVIEQMDDAADANERNWVLRLWAIRLRAALGDLPDPAMYGEDLLRAN